MSNGKRELAHGRVKLDVMHTRLKDDVDGILPKDEYIDFSIERETYLPVKATF